MLQSHTKNKDMFPEKVKSYGGRVTPCHTHFYADFMKNVKIFTYFF